MPPLCSHPSPNPKPTHTWAGRWEPLTHVAHYQQGVACCAGPWCVGLWWPCMWDRVFRLLLCSEVAV
jgi:hypothetical protein